MTLRDQLQLGRDWRVYAGDNALCKEQGSLTGLLDLTSKGTGVEFMPILVALRPWFLTYLKLEEVYL